MIHRLLISFLASICLPVMAQEPSAVPETLLYKHYFSFLANGRQRSPADGREHIGQLNSKQVAVVLAAAKACQREVALKDSEAQAVLAGFHKNFPDGKWPASKPLPPIPESLYRLQRERDSIIAATVSSLRAQLGEVGFKALDDYVRESIAPHITSTIVPLPRRTPGDPSMAVPPFAHYLPSTERNGQ